ncbi:MAG: TIGR00159 family protein, partial [Clostridia bacterium]|nr:TIGR00159 family protein [Clostridia bacterium]
MLPFQAWDFKQPLLIIIDIGIVAFVLYKSLLLVRGTRAVQLLKGLAILGFLS